MIAIATHDHADFDAFAAMVAARRLYGGGKMVLGRPVANHVHAFLSLHKDHFDLCQERDLDLDAIDQLVIVDTRDLRRLRSIPQLVARIRAGTHQVKVDIWDHHRASADDLVGDVVHVEPVGAATTLIVERLRVGDHQLKEIEATVLALGIHADTGSLTYPIATSRDAEALAWLLGQGANLKMIGHYLRTQLKPVQRDALLAVMAKTQTQLFAGVEVAFAEVTLERMVPGLAEVTSEALQAGGHSAMFALYAVRGHRVAVIGRAAAPWIDVGALMRRLGGGGHRGAGAVTLKNIDLKEARRRVDAQLAAAPPTPARVSELMSTPARSVSPELPLRALAEQLKDWNHTGVPVEKRGRVVGVVSVRDLQRAAQRGDMHRQVRACMSQNVTTIAPDAPLDDALRRMVGKDVGRLPVIEDGKLIGIITRSDVLRVLYAPSAPRPPMG